jgi:acylphosphatase
MATLHIIVKGKVQGVFFRATAKEVADTCGVKGWVRNTKEGDVEIMASGTEHNLQAFVDWCRKGPRKAVVSDVFITTEKESDFGEFKVMR